MRGLWRVGLGVGLGVAVALGARASDVSPWVGPSGLKARIDNRRVPLTWVFTGDSITQGAKWLGAERSYVELIQERIRWELGRPHDMVINSGVSGEITQGLLADYEWRVRRFKPDIVSVMIGMNNAVAGPEGRAAFASDLRELVRRIRAEGAIPILNGTNPIDSNDLLARSRGDLPAYNAEIRQVAEAESVIFVDNWAGWNEARPDLPALREWLANPIHPNAAGHRQLAIRFFQTLGIYDGGAPSCRP